MRDIKFTRKTVWDSDAIRSAALSCTSKSDFMRKFPGAYRACIRHQRIDDFKHFVQLRDANNKWTKEKCCEAAKACSTRNDFKFKYPTAYKRSRINGWWSEMKLSFLSVGNRYKRCIYSYEFRNNHVYVGLTNNIERRHSDRMKQKRDPVRLYIESSGLTPSLNQLTHFIDIENAQKMEETFLENYIKKGWVSLNSAKTGALGSTYRKWDKETCISVASKFKSLQAFRNKYPSGYNRSRKSNWLKSDIYPLFDTIKVNGINVKSVVLGRTLI